MFLFYLVRIVTTVVVTGTVARLKLQRRVTDAFLFQEHFQTAFYLLHVGDIPNDDVCRQGIVSSAHGPNVQVVYLIDMLLSSHQLLYLVRFDTLWRTVNDESQAGRQQTPGRPQDDKGDDEADDGVYDIPSREGNDDARDDDAY